MSRSSAGSPGRGRVWTPARPTSLAGATASNATTLTFSCSTQRQYRLFVSQNGSTRWEYHNGVGPSGSWTTSAFPHIDLN